MHRYHASFSAIASAGVASVRVESIMGGRVGWWRRYRAKNKGGRILQSRSGDKGSAREVEEYWLNRPGWCTSVWIFIQAGRKEKKMEEEDRSIARDDGQTCERFLKIVT